MYMYTYIFWNISVYTLSYLSPVQRWLRELFRQQNKLDQDPVSLLMHEILHHLGCNKKRIESSDVWWYTLDFGSINRYLRAVLV